MTKLILQPYRQIGGSHYDLSLLSIRLNVSLVEHMTSIHDTGYARKLGILSSIDKGEKRTNYATAQQLGGSGFI